MKRKKYKKTQKIDIKNANNIDKYLTKSIKKDETEKMHTKIVDGIKLNNCP